MKYLCSFIAFMIWLWAYERFFRPWYLRLRHHKVDCDSCIHDGECYTTMLKCKGYKRHTGESDDNRTKTE